MAGRCGVILAAPTAGSDDTKIMNHLDLFSGIGGFSLAARWMGWETVVQVEWDKWCQKVLAKNFPDALRFGDIKEFNDMIEDGKIITNTEGAGLLREKELGDDKENNGTGRGCNPSDIYKIHRENGEIITDNDRRCSTQSKEQIQTRRDFIGNSSKQFTRLGRIDIITGGFPCQPFSHAGKRKGVADERYLWPEMLRTIRIFKPSFVVGENVAGLVSMDNGKTLDAILSDLEDEGYQVESFIIPACAVGAWHRRDRIWIVGRRNDTNTIINSEGSTYRGSSRGSSRGWEEQNKCEWDEMGCDTSDLCKDVSNTNNGRFKKQRLNKSVQQDVKRETKSIEPKRTSSCDGQEFKARWWESEPSVGRVANGIPNRVDRLKGLGNAIVPQVVYQIFKAIEQLNRVI